ncbi:hypothetical protein [uncultured Reyranella sp.]|uniref:hypothetical protein n=1 Tax=uncultured Reyranella sp. TaxID=735512 RepID=UPI0025F4C30F|nr:hypothetical protein [uncultured Reyranella sp.]
MLIALNASYEYYTAIIRRKLDNYRPTLWTSGDLSTGTAEPKFDSLFHDLIPLRVILEYAGEGVIPSINAFRAELTEKEKQFTDFYGMRNYQVFTVTIADPGVITRKAHGLIVGDKVTFATTGALPTGLAVDTWYYVVQTSQDTFQVSATDGGTAITTSGSQSGTHYYASDRQGGMRPAPQNNK